MLAKCSHLAPQDEISTHGVRGRHYTAGMASRYRFGLRFVLLLVVPAVAVVAALLGKWPVPTMLAILGILYLINQNGWPNRPPPPR
jgi:hypothetical protein